MIGDEAVLSAAMKNHKKMMMSESVGCTVWAQQLKHTTFHCFLNMLLIRLP